MKDQYDAEEPIIDEPLPDVINDPEMFRMAVGRSQLIASENDEMPYVVVSKRLMKYLTKSDKISSITYGSPGVRVYLEGVKDELDRRENLSADAFHDDFIRNGHK